MRLRQVVLVILVAAAAMPSLAREPLTLAVVKERAAADAATPEGAAYLKQFNTNRWMLAWDAADEQCQAAALRSEVHDEFVLALVIGNNGYPTDALYSPEDDWLRCLADRLKATGFITPPHDGFAIYMPAKRAEPGAEPLSTP